MEYDSAHTSVTDTDSFVTISYHENIQTEKVLIFLFV